MPEERQNEISLAVLSNDIKHFTAAMLEMKSQLTNIITNFASKSDLAAFIENQGKLHIEIDRRVAGMETAIGDLRIRDAKLATEMKVWIIVGGFVSGGVLTGLFFFLDKIFK